MVTLLFIVSWQLHLTYPYACKTPARRIYDNARLFDLHHTLLLLVGSVISLAIC